MSLKIKELHVYAEGKEIVRGIDLCIEKGQIHALMGPNGSGKSTLSYALMGHPKYETKGEASLDGKDLLEMSVDERAKAGLFLSFQYPIEVAGVPIANFLRTAYNEMHEKKIDVRSFMALLEEKMKLLGMDRSFSGRSLNKGFSGGEKKRTEILQMAILQPKYVILDETDSGLDVDALKIVAQGIKKLAGPSMGVLLITHYQRILDYIKPDFVHVVVNGKIIRSGDASLAEEIERSGYKDVAV